MKDAKPRYPQFSAPDYPAFEAEINQFWKENDYYYGCLKNYA